MATKRTSEASRSSMSRGRSHPTETRENYDSTSIQCGFESHWGGPSAPAITCGERTRLFGHHAHKLRQGDTVDSLRLLIHAEPADLINELQWRHQNRVRSSIPVVRGDLPSVV